MLELSLSLGAGFNGWVTFGWLDAMMCFGVAWVIPSWDQVRGVLGRWISVKKGFVFFFFIAVMM